MGSVNAPQEQAEPTVTTDEPGARPAKRKVKGRGSASSATWAAASVVAGSPAVASATATLERVAASSMAIHYAHAQAVQARVAALDIALAPALAAAQQYQRCVDELFRRQVVPLINPMRQMQRTLQAVTDLWIPRWVDQLWSVDGALANAVRILDLAVPRLADVSDLVVRVLDSVRWVETFTEQFWDDLRRAGARVAYWAVLRVWDALDRGDLPALRQFISEWLGRPPDDHRVEALEEALLVVYPPRYRADEGHQLIKDLKTAVVKINAQRRRENETVLGLRRGGHVIGEILNPEGTVLHRLGMRGESSLEDRVRFSGSRAGTTSRSFGRMSAP